MVEGRNPEALFGIKARLPARSCVVDAYFLTADVSPHRLHRFLELGTEHIRDIACFGAKAHRRHWPSGVPEDVPSRNSLGSRGVAGVAAPAIGPLHTSSCAAVMLAIYPFPDSGSGKITRCPRSP